jgi:hypothetical protein
MKLKNVLSLTCGILCFGLTAFSAENAQYQRQQKTQKQQKSQLSVQQLMGAQQIQEFSDTLEIARCVAIKRGPGVRPRRFTAIGPTRRIACAKAMRLCQRSRPLLGHCRVLG